MRARHYYDEAEQDVLRATAEQTGTPLPDDYFDEPAPRRARRPRNRTRMPAPVAEPPAPVFGPPRPLTAEQIVNARFLEQLSNNATQKKAEDAINDFTRAILRGAS